MAGRSRDLALFDLGIDSKLRGCDLVKLRVRDVCHGDQIAPRAIIMQQKPSDRSSDFSVACLIHATTASRVEGVISNCTRVLEGWVKAIGLDASAYGTHSMRRTKASLIYRRTKNLRAVQLLLGHTKLESTVRYLGIEVDDALELAEQTEV